MHSRSAVKAKARCAASLPTPSDAGISIEPHMVVVFHDTHSKTANDADVCQNFIEYGRRLEKLIAEVKK